MAYGSVNVSGGSGNISKDSVQIGSMVFRWDEAAKTLVLELAGENGAPVRVAGFSASGVTAPGYREE